MLNFIVHIKRGPEVVRSFPAMAADSITCAEQHECLADKSRGEVVRCFPVDYTTPNDRRAMVEQRRAMDARLM